MRLYFQAKTLVALLYAQLLITGCGDGGYTKNADKTVQGSSDAKGDAQNANGSENEENETEQDSGETESGSSPNTGNTSSTNLEDLLDQLFGKDGKTGSGNNNNATNPTNPTKPTPVAPEPTSDDCIGADEFICAIEVAITFHTNNLRSAANPLTHHAQLSYVSREWSDRQAASGSISHRGFPDDRRRVYNQSFPGDTVSIQAENVAYSGSNSTSADDIAKMQKEILAYIDVGANVVITSPPKISEENF
jgi:uncharacterized protein YkwD